MLVMVKDGLCRLCVMEIWLVGVLVISCMMFSGCRCEVFFV